MNPVSPSAKPKVLLVAGTRPEAIKVAPVAAAARAGGLVEPVVVSAGQHPEVVLDVFALFGQPVDHALDFDRPTGGLAEFAGLAMPALDAVIDRVKPAAVLVQGDTATVLLAALAAHWRKVPVVHLEAGLRSGDRWAPFPEETTRRAVGQLADLHLSPTTAAAANLLAENIDPNSILVIGNTEIDSALTIAAQQPPRWADFGLAAAVDGRRRIVTVTAHRRESWGEPLLAVARAVRALADAHPDTVFVWAYHPNPAVRELVEPELAGHSGIVAVPALPYHPFLAVLARSCLTITDSGGVQEAGPALDVPVLVTREVTERPEGVAAGCAAVVGTTQPIIFAAAHRLLSDEPARLAMARIGCPYGDGRSGQRAAAALAWLVAGSDRPAPYQAN